MKNKFVVQEKCKRAISVGRSFLFSNLGDNIQVPGFLFTGRSDAPYEGGERCAQGSGGET